MHLAGVGPFITFRSYQLAGRKIIWRAREQRKGLLRAARALEHLPVPFWQTRFYNRQMGAAFAIGSSLFILGSLICFVPDASAELTALANIIFFLGSIPFTVAAYMQHFQAANAEPFSRDPEKQAPIKDIRLIGWKPHDLGWLSTLTQFIGTLAFNVSTLGGVKITNSWVLEDAVVWVPDMIGSILFLISAYLAFIEANHSLWRWNPKDLSWQIVFVNLVGCIAFMLSACTAYVLPDGPKHWVSLYSNGHLLAGAVCFLIGALLTIRESRAAAGPA